jgi:acyl dehydratase
VSGRPLEPGQALGPVVVGPVDPEKMKLMAAVLRDPNPIHVDPDSVLRLGLGDRVVTQGPMTFSFLVNAVADWAGGIPAIRSLEARYLENVFAGQVVECTGRVAARDAATGEATLELEARVEGRPVIVGTAVVAGP